MTLKVIQDHSIPHAIYHFLLVVCSYNDSIWHCFQDNNTFTVYVTGCDPEKSFIF